MIAGHFPQFGFPKRVNPMSDSSVSDAVSREAFYFVLRLNPEQARQLLKRSGAGDLAEFGEVGARLRRVFPETRGLATADSDWRMPRFSSRVFVGHGRSPVWKELKDFLQDRLGLEWEEYNREPTAGFTTIERIEQMLNGASFAFLVLTGEDEQIDASFHPRQNVVHEAGLFQARLGFRKAVLLVEESCTGFSNVAGLTQIRFPEGNIRAAFEDVRRVLEREGLIAAS